ncbi:uncharacterized protein LOC131145004 isoform X2 [Malania oleifera]|uniref:uncharacterized protein LOC131145004 isoform X2 n=1 Tax=Malania oleifera TaxID=397392 RepID=UPI0025AE17DD|nr:uncharacterized protein LOC131145004 isoform X2 [Malania oleifera]
MGNCQAIDAAVLVIQHPNGREERLYWPVTASEIMRVNPGHYVSLIIPLPLSHAHHQHQHQHQLPHSTPHDHKTVRFTRVKLLRPTDTLVLGHAYRLITSQVMKVLKAKKHAKMRKSSQSESDENLPMAVPENRSSRGETKARESELENTNQVIKHERHRHRTTAANTLAARSKSWRPSLQSISEAGS